MDVQQVPQGMGSGFIWDQKVCSTPMLSIRHTCVTGSFPRGREIVQQGFCVGRVLSYMLACDVGVLCSAGCCMSEGAWCTCTTLVA